MAAIQDAHKHTENAEDAAGGARFGDALKITNSKTMEVVIFTAEVVARSLSSYVDDNV